MQLAASEIGHTLVTFRLVGLPPSVTAEKSVLPVPQ